jgi:hypothetical protein
MQRQARTAGRLREPHVVPIHDFGGVDGQLYVDMRLIDGVDVGIASATSDEKLTQFETTVGTFPPRRRLQPKMGHCPGSMPVAPRLCGTAPRP